MQRRHFDPPFLFVAHVRTVGHWLDFFRVTNQSIHLYFRREPIEQATQKTIKKTKSKKTKSINHIKRRYTKCCTMPWISQVNVKSSHRIPLHQWINDHNIILRLFWAPLHGWLLQSCLQVFGRYWVAVTLITVSWRNYYTVMLRDWITL